MMRLNRPLQVKSFDEQGIFEGYGSVFGVEDHYHDVVERGAFAKTLAKWRAKGRLPPLLWQHDTEKPIGVYEHMEEDEHGLQVRGRLLIDDVPLAREAWALLKAGAITGLSIGYNTLQAEVDRQRNVLLLKEIDLWETSLVTFPANEQAGVTHIKTIREFERFLRDSGFSKNEALRIASSGFKARRDADDEAEEDGGAALIKAAILKNIRIIKGD